jgi:hypothetical protein
MPAFLHTNKQGYPPYIRCLQLIVCALTILGALWYDYFVGATVGLSPKTLLLAPEITLKTLFQIFTAPFIIVYPEISISLFFDLVVLNALITPIYTFVYSFVGKKDFLHLIIGLILVGETCFLIASQHMYSSPCSLFSSLTLSIIVFWAMLHSQGKSFFLLAFPISPAVYLGITTAAVLYPILLNAEMAKLLSTLCMASTSYLVAIVRYRLRSNVAFLKYIENTLQRFC